MSVIRFVAGPVFFLVLPFASVPLLPTAFLFFFALSYLPVALIFSVFPLAYLASSAARPFSRGRRPWQASQREGDRGAGREAQADAKPRWG